jgi:hypothetical protein
MVTSTLAAVRQATNPSEQLFEITLSNVQVMHCPIILANYVHAGAGTSQLYLAMPALTITRAMLLSTASAPQEVSTSTS